MRKICQDGDSDELGKKLRIVQVKEVSRATNGLDKSCFGEMIGKGLTEEMCAYREMGQLLEGIWNQHFCLQMGMIRKDGETNAKGERSKSC